MLNINCETGRVPVTTSASQCQKIFVSWLTWSLESYLPPFCYFGHKKCFVFWGGGGGGGDGKGIGKGFKQVVPDEKEIVPSQIY